nr:expressed protein [Hymenolepis microstoma]
MQERKCPVVQKTCIGHYCGYWRVLFELTVLEKEHASGKSIKVVNKSADFDSTCAVKGQMEEEKKEDAHSPETSVESSEDEEERNLRVDSQKALLRMPSTKVDSLEWRRLKKKVIAYKRYLRNKADYLEQVTGDSSSSGEYNNKLSDVIGQLVTVEDKARGIHRRKSSKRGHQP